MAASTKKLLQNLFLQRFSRAHKQNDSLIRKTFCYIAKTSRLASSFTCRRCLLFMFPTTVHAFGFGSKKIQEEKKEELRVDPGTHLIEEADKLYRENKMLEIYNLLIKEKDCDNADILWRLARATRDKGKLSKNKTEQKQCVYEAFEYAKKALDLDDMNFACHKWYAIMLNYTGEYEGTKKQISNAFLVKKHFLKAAELNPRDATSIHSMGQWCFVFADLAWYERKIASALFASPPSSTYSEALYYFQLAEEVDPNFYSKNLMMIGKTHLRMKNYKLATDYLVKARDYEIKTPDDQEAHDESVKLLSGLGIKTD